MKHIDMRKLAYADQEERRRQVIWLRESGLSYDAIGRQVGLSRHGVSGICKRFAELGMAGLESGQRGRHRARGGSSRPTRKRRSAG